MKGDAATDDPNPADQLVRHRASSAEGHVVLHFADALVMEEPRDQDGGVRPIELLAAEVVTCRGDAEAPARLVVQQSGEDTGGVEVRQAQPVDGTVHPDQRGGAQVADNAVMLYGLVARPHRTAL